MTRALLVSLSAPEMDRLAVELGVRGALQGLVRRYANKRRWWERAVARLPFLGKGYAGTLGRRLPPAGLDAGLVIEAGVLADFAAAMVNRAGRHHSDAVLGLSKWLLAATEASVAEAASRYVVNADCVVGSYHVAYPAFRRAQALGRRTFLNYPIAHHRWQYRFYAAQAQRRPEFAAALPRFGDVDRHAAMLDREIELADTILVGSRFVRDTFVSEGIPAERLHVIPYGADPDRFTPAVEPQAGDQPFRVLFVGQIGERKGMSYLLDAYAAFRKPDTELHLVGNFVGGSEVYERYRGLYRHTAHVPQAQLPELFRAADVFVLPSLVEGMPMVVVEAMACGVPVIVTPHGPADVVRDGVDGYVVPVCDSEAILDRLERMYADRRQLTQMGRAAREHAERWTWQRYATAAADLVQGR